MTPTKQEIFEYYWNEIEPNMESFESGLEDLYRLYPCYTRKRLKLIVLDPDLNEWYTDKYYPVDKYDK